MFLVLVPLAVVQALRVVVDALALFLVKRPVAIVIMVRAVLVLALAMLFAVLEVALVNG